MADRRLRAMAWGWLLLGAAAFALGALMLLAAAQFVARSTPTQGVVLRLEGDNGGAAQSYEAPTDPYVVPVVRYHDQQGRERELRGQHARPASRSPAVGSGVSVRVLHQADGTVAARIDDRWDVWGLPGLLTGFGAGFLLAGWAGLRATRA